MLWLADLEKEQIGPNFNWIKLVNDFEAEYSVYVLDHIHLSLDLYILEASEMTEQSSTFILMSRRRNIRLSLSTLKRSVLLQGLA